MAEKTTPEDYETNRTSVKSYASRVFKESSVGMVNSLAHTASVRRRIFKVVALILCLTGFFYQSGTFLAAVFQYPTSVDISIKRPKLLPIPAYTFCDNNAINRGIFCTKFPERCEEPDEAFCAKFENYCDGNRSVVPKKEFYWLNTNLTLEELTELNVDVNDFVVVKKRNEVRDISGPFFRARHVSLPAFICYSLNDRVNNSLPPGLERTQNKLHQGPISVFKFIVEPEEMFLPGNQPGILFDIHSPFLAVNPFETGIFLKPGQTYMIFVNTEEEILLQDPYDTSCVNYTEIWEKNGFKGPRLQDMCIENCIADVSVQCFNCVIPLIKYPRKERYCFIEDMNERNCPKNTGELLEDCEHLKCRDDCTRTKFSYTIQERFMPNFDIQGDILLDLDRIIEVEIYLNEDEVMVLKHSPKYMFVEVFSNIGGFIGCWLGFNLLDITDIFEGFFRILRYSFRRRRHA